ncbi:Fic/DOC family protein [Granulicella aggregans]|uniref:Fic/DOC family protein n=1 Tax=Granulicella aggregans TaxID=474949 RepID=UPI0021E0D5F4|nr:Fic family protein [Granulicella aggregans]
MSSGFTNDPHSELGNACPRNLFKLTNYADLHALEAPLVFTRIGEMRDRGVTGDFDTAHLLDIHKYLFQDVFPWAGELRVVDISKGNTNFGPAMQIGSALHELFNKLAKEKLLTNLNTLSFITRAAFYLGEINAIHPFREGNGRSQREFIRPLALHAGHPLSWSLVGTGFTQQQMIDASILSHTQGDNTQLAAIIEAALFSRRASKSSSE